MRLMAALAWLSWIPALGLILAFPRRKFGAWAGVFLCLAAVASWALLSPKRPEALALLVWDFCACVYAAYVCRRDGATAEMKVAAVAQRRASRDGLKEELETVKTQGAQAGRDQREAQALYGLVKGIAESLSWEEIRPKIERTVSQYLGVTDFALYVADMHIPGQFHCLTAKNLIGTVGGSWLTLARYLEEHGLSASQPHALDNPEQAVAMPIQENAEILGYFYARVPRGVDPTTLLNKAWSFVSEIAFALRRIKLFQEVERLSRIDGLTGVHRRGDFDDKLREEALRAKTFKTTFALMLLDIDHFKRLNDGYGHPFGDQVLRRVGELLNSLVYETDFVARYGGEEFVIVLPRAEPAGVMRKAEMIRRAIEAERFEIALEKIPVTVSIGIAHFPRDAAGPEDLVARADAAMYQAKSLGRNQVADCAALRHG